MATEQQPISVNSELMARSQLARMAGNQFNGKRNLYDSLGYKSNLVFEDYFHKYDRGDIAGRIVNAAPNATWRNAPTIKEDDDKEHDTAFESAWEALEKKHNILHYLERVDRLAGIGRFGILVIGVRGDSDLSKPIRDNSLNGIDDIIFFSPYSEKRVEIRAWVTDPGNPRFGKPETYKVDFAGDLDGANQSLKSKVVHHTRVIHVAEELLEDEVYGTPRLKRVMNRLEDLEKVVGGSGEMFWRGAFKGLHFDVRSDGHLEEGDEETMSQEIDEYIHGLRRYIRTKGIDAQSLGSDVADPSGVFETIISLISGATHIPKRILLGSERGELASNQDETNWNSYISERQTTFAEPQILRELIDRLIRFGALPKPEEDYQVEWPNLFEMSDKEKAEVADKVASAIQKLAPFGETDQVVSIEQYVEKVLAFTGMEAQQVRPRPGLNGPDQVEESFRQQVRGSRDE